MASCNSSTIKCCISKLTWHSRFGHPSDQTLNTLKDTLNFKPTPIPPCEVCHKAKQTREPFPTSLHSSKTLGDLIHLDLWGPYRVTSVGGFKYFLTIVDDFTRGTWVYLRGFLSLERSNKSFLFFWFLFVFSAYVFCVIVRVIESICSEVLFCKSSSQQTGPWYIKWTVYVGSVEFYIFYTYAYYGDYISKKS